MDILEIIQTLRELNSNLAIIVAVLSIYMLYYTARMWRDIRRTENPNTSLARSFFFTAVLFFVGSLFKILLFEIIYTSDDRVLINLLANIDILIAQLLAINVSVVWLAVFFSKK